MSEDMIRPGQNDPSYVVRSFWKQLILLGDYTTKKTSSASALENSRRRRLSIVWFDKARAVKATIRRPLASGDVGERDVYGAQQHAPLMNLEICL